MASKASKKSADTGSSIKTSRRSRPRGQATPSPSSAPPERELVDMEQAIRLLKTTRPTFYRWLRSGTIRGLKVGRQWRFERKEIERFLKGEPPQIGLRADITPLLETLLEKCKEYDAPQTSLPDQTDAQRTIKLMIELALALNAGDIHLAPHDLDNRKVGVLRYRVDGVLREIARLDPRLISGIVEQWRIMAGCSILEEKPQDGRIDFQIGDEKKPGEILFCYLPTFLGGSFTARIAHRDVKTLTLDNLDYAPRDKECLLRSINAPNGLILSTGPAGSGKTTVIYACLNQINSPAIKIFTLEDPLYCTMPWMVQIQVSENLNYSEAIKAILRSDPDVIFIGELRDGEVVNLAHRLSLTGHRVISQLHVDRAARGLVRMIEMGAEPFTVAESTRLVISQRLARRLCPDCNQPETLPTDLQTRVESYARLGGLDCETLAKNYRKPVGCPRCKNLGFQGRLPIAEFLEVTPEIRSALRRGADVDELQTIAVSQGMTTIAADGIRKAAEGKTTIDEIIRILALS